MTDWRPIPGFPAYEASADGEIRNAATGLILAQRQTPKGHYRVKLVVQGRRRDQYVQRVVCLAFHGRPPRPGMVAGHRDGNPGNNRPGNLRWITEAENAADKRRHGTAPIGAQNPAARLDEWAVVLIRAWSAARLSDGTVARLAGVSPKTVSRIRTGRSWGEGVRA